MNEEMLRIKRVEAGNWGNHLAQLDANIPSMESKRITYPPRKLIYQPSGVARPPSKAANQGALFQEPGDRKRDQPACGSGAMPIQAPHTISRESFVGELSDSRLACW